MSKVDFNKLKNLGVYTSAMKKDTSQNAIAYHPGLTSGVFTPLKNVSKTDTHKHNHNDLGLGQEAVCTHITQKITSNNDSIHYLKRFDQFGIIKPGCVVQQGDILVRKCNTKFHSNKMPEEQLLYDIFTSNSTSVKDTQMQDKAEGKDTSFVLSDDIHARILQTFYFPEVKAQNKYKGSVIIYFIIKRRIQIGDKLAGRHGNKGIVCNIVPKHDMPYISDGTTLDIVLNPLGVPSRMNVGQVYECLLGMAGKYLHENYRVTPFDESYGSENSRALVYKKLLQASYKNNLPWLFHGSHPGKTKVFDGRSGEVFEHPITVGVSYIMKLVHLVDEKMHARSTGPYSLITQQPLKGRSKHGGQRLGEMEVWAFQAFGAAYLLQEMMTIKSDDIYGRNHAFTDILRNNAVKEGSIPESFRVLAYELRALCFDILYT
jgi:DNA-directed RNA polymerase subunit beta